MKLKLVSAIFLVAIAHSLPFDRILRAEKRLQNINLQDLMALRKDWLRLLSTRNVTQEKLTEFAEWIPSASSSSFSSSDRKGPLMKILNFLLSVNNTTQIGKISYEQNHKKLFYCVLAPNKSATEYVKHSTTCFHPRPYLTLILRASLLLPAIWCAVPTQNS